jgi:hypothetical protein
MAAMEKITYPPLVAHLQDEAVFYNQLYQRNELKYGPIDRSLIARWVVHVVEPIIREVDTRHPDRLPEVFKVFYSHLLQLLGNKAGIVHEAEYQATWKLCMTIPALTGQFPARLVAALHAGILSIRTYQPDKTLHWLSLMEYTGKSVQSLDEFLAVGRVNAWLIGMAHLREKAQEEFSNLRADLKQELQRNTPNVDIGQALGQDWLGTSQPAFIGEAGGFIGHGGYFTAPPKVATIGDHVLATDGRQSGAFFADTLGQVLVTEVPVQTSEILEKASKKPLDAFKAKYGKQLIPFDDVTSAIMHRSTLVLTRASSHYLYVYGWTN